MPKFVTALFEDEQEADRAIKALEEAGYRGDAIRHVESKRDPWSGVFRLELEVMEFYARRIPEGNSLVAVLCGDSQVEEVEGILQEFEVRDPEEMLEAMVEEAARFQERSGSEKPRLESGAPTGRWFEVVEVKEEEWVEREGAKAHAVHVRPKKDVKRMHKSEFPGARQSGSFEGLEAAFRRHFHQELEEEGYGYEELKLAYRFGVQLGENRRFRQKEWAEVEEFARKTWEGRNQIDWDVAGEAVFYGWAAAPRDGEERRAP